MCITPRPSPDLRRSLLVPFDDGSGVRMPYVIPLELNHASHDVRGRRLNIEQCQGDQRVQQRSRETRRQMLITTLYACYSVGALAAPRLDLYATRGWLRMVGVQFDGCVDELPHCPDGM